MENKRYNPVIDYLKGIAAIFVVIGHSITYLQNNYAYTVPAVGSVIGNVVSAVHVPMFILISGYLCHKQEKKTYLKKKVRRVVVPFLFFSVLKFVFEIAVKRGSVTTQSLLHKAYDVFLIGRAYWFVYCIFLIYLIAMLFWEAKAQRFILPVALALFLFNSAAALTGTDIFPEQIQIGKAVLKEPLFQIERVMQYLPYFLLGMWLREGSLLRMLDKHEAVAVVCSLLVIGICAYLVVSGITNKHYFVKLNMALSEMIVLRAAVKRVKGEAKSLKTVGLYSFQVMLFDGFYRVILYAAISKAVQPDFPISMGIAAVVVVLAVISCIAARRNRLASFLIGI